MAYCTKCGTQVAEGVKFCTSCGAPIGVAQQPQPQQPPQQQTYQQPQQQSYGQPYQQPPYGQPYPQPAYTEEPISTGKLYADVPAADDSDCESALPDCVGVWRQQQEEQGKPVACDALLDAYRSRYRRYHRLGGRYALR